MSDENVKHNAFPLTPAVFLDRDGTLIEDIGNRTDPADIRLFPDTVPALLKLQTSYRLFVITDQDTAEDGRGLKRAEAVNQALDKALSAAGVVIQHWYADPRSLETKPCLAPCRASVSSFSERDLRIPQGRFPETKPCPELCPEPESSSNLVLDKVLDKVSTSFGGRPSDSQSRSLETKPSPEPSPEPCQASVSSCSERRSRTSRNRHAADERADPRTACVVEARRRYGIDLSRSFVVGDQPQDTRVANELGVFGLCLLTGRGGRLLGELEEEKLVFHQLSDAADWILSHPGHERDLAREIAAGAAAIRGGGCAAFPTETVYGLGADVFQPDAVERIFTIKGRPRTNPLIAHIASAGQVESLAATVPADARKLMDAFWPGPLTLVLPKRGDVPDCVTGGLPTVAIRMPAQPIARELIRRCGTPLAAPSANRFTCTSPTTARHVKDQLGDQCPVVIDGGACRVGVESTVISFTGPVPVLLRPGGVAVEDIEQVIGRVDTIAPAAGRSPASESPGMMANHYAPATRLRAFETIPTDYESRSDIGVLLFRPSARRYAGHVETLSQSGDTREAAANFFAALRRLDQLNLSEIVAEYAPDHGLGRALNNRLSKAANGRL
ncbi:MAG: L-threonylcarbamoyladenylate synthase [Lentisphaeria bacterium]|nr:L-threonylcarbamoyladenylate synthase [Lentisphaeria bacterium]